MRFRARWLLLVVTCSTSLAFPSKPESAPVERLVRNAERYLQKHPKEADAFYTLGRVHYMAFRARRKTLATYSLGDENNKPSAEAFPLQPGDNLSNAEILTHAGAAEANFRFAILFGTNSARYQLSLASLLEEARTWIEWEKPKSVPPALAKITIADLRQEYWKAFELALGFWQPEQVAELRPDDGFAAIESAGNVVRLSKEGGLTEEERRRVTMAQAALDRQGALAHEMTSPIVFAMERKRTLAELLAPGTTVDFPLRGFRTEEKWPWVKPELGFLVWDPLKSGVISSARQMFGGYTFQIFRRTGYDALAALDDDDDGMLSGKELDGLRVWFDRDSDGVSSEEEVVDLSELGIRAISTCATGNEGIHPMNSAGLTLCDGRTLPTWDWIVEPRFFIQGSVTIKR